MTREDLPTTGWALIALPVLTFSAVSFQAAMFQQLVTNLLLAWPKFVLIVGSAPVAYGAGMYIAFKMPGRAQPHRPMRAVAGAATTAGLLAFACALRINPITGSNLAIGAATAVFGVAAIAGHGALYSATLLRAGSGGPAAMGRAVAASLIGVAAGFSLRIPLSVGLGANAMVIATLSIPLAVVATSRRAPVTCIVAAAVVVAASWLPTLDQRIETLRNTTDRMERFRWFHRIIKDEDLENLEPVLNTWSPFAKINISRVRGTQKLVGAYNYFIAWVYDEVPDPRRQRFFSFIEPDDDVLMVAVGGGWPVRALPPKGSGRRVAVEMDATVAGFFTEHPELNHHTFVDVELVVAEGRSYIDSADGRFDVIIVDLPGSPAAVRENPSFFEDYLFTLEAVERYTELLGDDGVFCGYLGAHQLFRTVPAFREGRFYMRWFALPHRTSEHLPKEPFRLFLASHNRQRVDEIAEMLLTDPPSSLVTVEEVRRRRGVEPQAPMLDDRPFSARDAELGAYRYEVAISGWAVLVAAFLTLLATLLVRGGRHRWRLAFFAAIGVGLASFHSLVYLRFRSYLGDPLTTTTLTTMLLMLAAAAGAAMAPRWKGKWWKSLVIVGAVLAHTVWSLHHIPVGLSAFGPKLLATAAIVGPFAFISGFYFPIGLIRVKSELTGRALLVDALGGATGLLLFYAMYWRVGATPVVVPMVIAYGLATVLALRD